MKFEFKIGEIKKYVTVTVDEVETDEMKMDYLKDLEISGEISEQEIRETNIDSYMNKIEELIKTVSEIKGGKN